MKRKLHADKIESVEPKTLAEARQKGWRTLQELLPDPKAQKLFSVWKAYDVVPGHVQHRQFWDAEGQHTITLWNSQTALFLGTAFLLRPLTTLQGRRPKVAGGYGRNAPMFAPLRIALWAWRPRWAYDPELIRKSLLYAVEIASRSKNAMFSRTPHRFDLAFLRHERSGEKLKTARESALSLLFPDAEDYYPTEPDTLDEQGHPMPRPLDARWFREYTRKIRGLDARRKILIERLKKDSIQRVREAIKNADPNALARAKTWARSILYDILEPTQPKPASKKQRHTRGAPKTVFERLAQADEAAESLLAQRLSALGNPGTARSVCANLGVYIGLRLLALEAREQ